MSKYSLRLYITGKTGRSQQALKNLESICKTELSDRYDLEVIDISGPHLLLQAEPAECARRILGICRGGLST